jgi:NAD dependent epimerase/dehydratase family enzyme
VNAVAPNPVTNREFTATVSELMKKPALFPVPAAALKLIFGEMASETILASQRAIPTVLAAAGFEFTKPTLRDALRA